MAKKNVKEWIKDHKTGVCVIAGAAVGIAATICGVKIANHVWIKRHGVPYCVGGLIKVTLMDAERKIQGPYNVFAIAPPEAYKPEELGRLGESMMKNEAYDPSYTYSHIIAIGKGLEK